MGPKQRLTRLETKTAPPAAPVDRAVLLARVMAKLDAVAAGATLPPADWTNANPSTVAHRAARLRRMESRSHD